MDNSLHVVNFLKLISFTSMREKRKTLKSVIFWELYLLIIVVYWFAGFKFLLFKKTAFISLIKMFDFFCLMTVINFYCISRFVIYPGFLRSNIIIYSHVFSTFYIIKSFKIIHCLFASFLFQIYCSALKIT